MTGASLPADADCIIPVERITVDNNVASLETATPAKAKTSSSMHGAPTTPAGTEELVAGHASLRPWTSRSLHLVVYTEVEVAKQPTIRVISTGNELVPAGQPIEDHQIRLSNGPALIAMLADHGYHDCQHDHLVDDESDMLEKTCWRTPRELRRIVLSGGVSMGKADYRPASAQPSLALRSRFTKVSQRPGKPMWFGIGPEGQSVFALPGNPVSTLVCCRQYVIPALQHASGMTAAAPQFASLAQDVTFRPQLTNFLPVRLISNAAGQVLAMPVPTNTSGDFAALSGTDGYVELALEHTDFKTGTAVPLHRW